MSGSTFADTGPLVTLLSRNDLEAQARPVAELLARYSSVPMDLADACLVRMTELEPTGRVLTLDGDFRIYRRAGRRVVPTLMP